MILPLNKVNQESFLMILIKYTDENNRNADGGALTALTVYGISRQPGIHKAMPDIMAAAETALNVY